MAWYTKENDAWTDASGPTDGAISIQVRASDRNMAPAVRFLQGSTPFFHLTGTDPRSNTDTTHTIARIDPDSAAGALVCAVHADANDLLFEDLRPAEEVDTSDSAVDHVQSALNEILVPVYIDDVVSDLSERVSGLTVVHTVQYDPKTDGEWSYFRTSVFRNGDLALEDEFGSLST